MAKKSDNPDRPKEGARGDITCVVCGKTLNVKLTATGMPRLPIGWHRHPELGPHCNECWNDKYKIRAVTFPIRGPVGEGVTWEHFRAALKTAWRQSTAATNWIANQLSNNDVVRMPEDTKMPKMKQLQLYHAVLRRFPGMSTQSCVSLINTTTRRWKAVRKQVVWWSSERPARYRYPQPYPVHNGAWFVAFDKDRTPLLSFPLVGSKWTVRLAGGAQMRHQLKGFSQLVAGKAFKCELQLYRRSVHKGDHRNGVKQSSSGGGPPTYTRVMAKLVAWLPREDCVTKGEGVLEIKTGPEKLWAGIGPSGTWDLNADHVRAWAWSYRKFLDRMAQDTKHERRKPKRKKKNIKGKLTTRGIKHKNRIDTFCKQAAAMLGGYAIRQNVEEVVYNDVDKSYMPEDFEWSKLALAIKKVLDDARIKFTHIKEKEKEPE